MAAVGFVSGDAVLGGRVVGMCFLFVTVVADIVALWCAVLLVTRESDVAVRTQ